AVGKRAFDLDLCDERRHAGHDLARAEDRAAEIHQLGDRAAVADQLEQLRREQRDRFGIVQPQAAREAFLRDDARTVEYELVEVTWREPHAAVVSPLARPRI